MQYKRHENMLECAPGNGQLYAYSDTSTTRGRTASTFCDAAVRAMIAEKEQSIAWLQLEMAERVAP
jgi:hypothetical protein